MNITSKHQRVECTFPARLEALKDIRLFIEMHCMQWGVSKRQCWALVLACDEICSNIIRHGYRLIDGETLSLGLSMVEHSCSVTIRDTAPPFNPVRMPRREFNLARSGHGLDLANRVATIVYLPKRGRRCYNITSISVPIVETD